MSPTVYANTAEIQAILRSISLEVALVEPGGTSGLMEIDELLARLGDLLPPGSTNDLSALVETGAAVISSTITKKAAWTQKQIEEVSLWLTTAEQALQDIVRVEANAPAASSNAGGTDPAVLAEDDAEEEAIVLDVHADQELLAEFCNEGRDLLQDIEKGILVLEETPSHAETLNSVFRAFHTFKGGAGFLGLRPVKSVAHELESLLDAIRQGRMTVNSHVIDLILAGGDCLRQFVDVISREIDSPSAKPIRIPTSSLVRQVAACLSGEAPQPPASSTAAPEQAADSSASASADTRVSAPVADSPRATEARPAAAVPIAPRAPASASRNDTTQPAPESGDAKTSIRIGLEKLDTLVDLVAELVIAQAMVIQNPELKQVSDPNLSRDILVLQRITKELQHNAMSLRMVPIRGAFQKMNRLVRDLAASQGKQIQLVIQGEDTEIDRNIVAELSDPLIHMVRNSCDHGIEAPDVRAAAGKPPVGTVRLSAFYQGGGIVIRISDDGKGMDPERIYQKALERGMVEPGVPMSKEEILELIFAPGFSTAAAVTDISGRGVGMDVVRGNISKLRGRIEINSEPGTGSTFTVFLPLTLAIIDGMVVGVGQNRYIIPTLAVRESFRPTPDMISTVFGRGKVVRKRGRLIPLMHLGEYLGVDYRETDAAEGIVILVESGTTQRCILVDSLIGKSEVVIKDLGQVFESQEAMSGAAIMGDGRVALILDIDAIASHASMAQRGGGQWLENGASSIQA